MVNLQVIENSKSIIVWIHSKTLLWGD